MALLGRRIDADAARVAIRALKPADWLALTFLVATIPLVVLAQEWGGVLFRAVVIPSVACGRYFFATSDHFPSRIHRLFLFLLDIYPIVTCVYLYGEDGKTLQYLYPDQKASFWDDAIKQADSSLLGVPVESGTGAAIRARTSATFNRVFGEYLHFAYFAFYVILAGTPLIGWLVLPREHFDRLMTSQTLVYLTCIAAYLFFPTAGPYWAYPDQRPDPSEVGYLFSHVTHFLVGGGSSLGTAFPSGHCSITVSAMVVSLVYLPRVFMVYLFIGPALVVATVWGGFHYFYDALFGVLLGLVGAAVGIATARVMAYIPPASDSAYSTLFRMNARQRLDQGMRGSGGAYASLPGDDDISAGLTSKKPAMYIPALSPRTRRPSHEWEV